MGDKEKQAKNPLLTMQRMNQLSLKSNFSANEIYTRFVTSRFTVIMHHTCHDVFVIKSTTHPDFSQYLSKFVGKNTNFRNDAGQSLERKEGREKKSFSLSFSASKNGWWKRGRERVERALGFQRISRQHCE